MDKLIRTHNHKKEETKEQRSGEEEGERVKGNTRGVETTLVHNVEWKQKTKRDELNNKNERLETRRTLVEQRGEGRGMEKGNGNGLKVQSAMLQY